MPTASVVIPCYNAAKFVEATVRSAQEQTVRDIEIICVDDGSTDATLELLRNIAEKDTRVRVIAQENGGEGVARDRGLCEATGDWLYFLDADDLMMPQLLETSIARAEQTGADVVVFRTMMLDDQTGEEYLCAWSFQRDWTEDDTFRPQDHPAHLFNSFQNWVHNKLFRGSFVREHNLHMQHVHRTADLLFTCRALAEAGLVALLDEPLHHYRVNNAQSAMATSDQYPLDFYEAFLALRASLEEHGTWELYHDSFVNWAIDGVAFNLRVARNYEAYQRIAATMCTEGFDRLGIRGFPREKSDMLVRYDQIEPLVNGDPQEALFRLATQCRNDFDAACTSASHARVHVAQLEREVTLAQERQAHAEEDAAGLRHVLDCVMGSTSFKAGRALTFVPRNLAALARRKR
ncbi:MAG: glycosyltransferase family 2 protein [Atopobiaceae bacterium]|nr:glycosyltransferase family 2 protein [Atopobiaceae bacterium]